MDTAAVDYSALRERYLAAQLAGDRREALRLLVDEGLGRGAEIETLQRVIRDAQHEIGRLWQENRISVAEEHMATAISNAALSHLFDRAPHVPANGRKVLVACVEGEQHDFPARLVADALDLAGFHVRYLGANVPTESLLSAIHKEQPDLVALSTTMAFNLPALKAAVARVRAHGREGLLVAIGGGACAAHDCLPEDLGADATARDAAEFVDAAARLLGVTR